MTLIPVEPEKRIPTEKQSEKPSCIRWDSVGDCWRIYEWQHSEVRGESGVTRLCACGCPASMEGKKPSARYATDACRIRHWKERKGYAHPRSENARNGDFWRRIAEQRGRSVRQRELLAQRKAA